MSPTSHEASIDAEHTSQRIRRAALVLAGIAVALLTACSGGEGGKDVTIGSGQDADPVTVDFPVFYVKRPVPDPDAVLAADARELLRFEIGADLFMRDRASSSTAEINLTAAQTEGLGDVRDVNVNFDGTKVVFAMRAKFIEGADEADQPTWNIWEYDTQTKALRRVIASDTTAEEGHDIMPRYLPDGRIVFSSTRQRQSRAILLDENKPQYAAQVEGSGGNPNPAFVLHVMDPDGGNIHQISFNQSHDLDPAVLADGRILYTRWEHALDDDQMDLYTVRPDGTELRLLYGANSHQTGTVDPLTGQASTIQFLKARAMPDGRTLALILPFTGTSEGGNLVLIDTANYVDNTRGGSVANAGLTGPAQSRALPTDVRTIPGPSPGGRYRSASPLFDGTNRLLVSWSQCRLMQAGRIVPCTADRLSNTVTPPVEAPPLYGVYIYDVRDNTQKPIVAPQEGFIYTEVAAGAPQSVPTVILDRMPGADFPGELLTESAGILHIRSVYDVDGVDMAPGGGIAAVRDPANPAYANRPARFLRIEKAVSQPDRNTHDTRNSAFGPNGRRFGMRDILGYAPIEPDGSVKVKVPANVPFAISVLDGQGRRLSGLLGNLHTNWLQVMPGETLECNGCHNPNATPPIAHGRAGLTNSVNAGATANGTAFPNTNPLLAPLDAGETMAQARGRAMCGGACEASVDIVFDDYWPAAAMTKQPSYDLCYTGGATNVRSDPADLTQTHLCEAKNSLLTTAIPTAAACRAKWNGLCRITINYEQHIHPLWSVDRFVDANGDGMPDDDGTGKPINHKCTSCHSPTAADGTAQIPKGDLDLSDGASDEQPDQFRSYRELLFADRGQVLNMGAPEDECLQTQVDPDTGVVTCIAYRNVPASMSAAGAAASTRFFQKFDDGGGAVDHHGLLTPAELKMLAEWLDIGAQYYNNPFAAPEN